MPGLINSESYPHSISAVAFGCSASQRIDICRALPSRFDGACQIAFASSQGPSEGATLYGDRWHDVKVSPNSMFNDEQASSGSHGPQAKQ
jgi:hypothetical protein